MTPNPTDEPFTLAFIGHSDPQLDGRAAAYEDEALALLAHHGARLLYRGRRAPGQGASLPLEVHLLWFPRRAVLDAYLADDRRRALLEKYGEVFTHKQLVELTTLVGPTTP